MQNLQPENITLDTVVTDALQHAGISATMLRLDKIHPVIAGNKWFKLRFYLDEFRQSGKKSLVTFGGAWSNHIVATAAACRLNDIRCTGIIRGERPAELSATLKEAASYGMQFCFLSREDYKYKNLPAALAHTDPYIIPEGGYGINGMKGAATILDFIQNEQYTHICCATGTGTMTAGLLTAADRHTQVCSISVLKNNHSLEDDIRSLVSQPEADLHIIHDYHFGGYAKHSPGLLRFMNRFFEQTGIPSDFVYTGKLFYAMTDLATKNYFLPGSRLLLVHSGGLQGNASLNKGTLIF